MKKLTQFEQGFEKGVKACGGCTLCFGKGYSTQGHGGKTVYNTCVCPRGKDIRKLIYTVERFATAKAQSEK